MQTVQFTDILQEAKTRYGRQSSAPTCPDQERLVDYAYGDLPSEEQANVFEHVRQCERCHIAVLKMKVEHTRLEWQLKTAYEQEVAQFQAVEAPIYDLPQWGSLVAEYYAEPQENKVANTALAQSFEGGQAFDTEVGTITVDYLWGTQGDTPDTAFIWLGWSAELNPDAGFAIRILTHEEDRILLELSPEITCCENEAKFQAIQTTGRKLTFDPIATPWDVAVSVFRKE